ncbi:sensor histidine kinase [Enterococcus xiangfangensis]|uniref:histidine kinase n=1 Tax=Enterococcus xiangfangensis TaxID=1296537 RepID=A0ABU3FAT2_9ENTE|nr:HAMP domain-containing sensor histidine kinase [Enterococcus xiangfangensis]MBM7712532.1 signal transduction histidine kinase [Enterococcus xiangfangensis]MDT2759764.1 HAMP domain-containing sensor histidine kinase [Enterococcus xiangfangensis]NBK08872.1 sensor histidine kinase [Enterococcus asini]
MWGIASIVGLLLLIGGSYLYGLKRELRRLQQQVKELPEHASHGGRIAVEFHENDLVQLAEAVNQLVTGYEEQNIHSKQLEKNLQQAITGLSHDLRTPLTAISGYTQLLEKENDSQKQQQYLQNIHKSVERLIEMNEHFYELAKIELNQQPIQQERFSSYQRLEELFITYYEQFTAQQLTVRFPENVPETWILGDPLLYTRIVQNIIQNSLRYAKEQIIISVNVDKQVVLQIKNDLNDPSLDIQRVFDRFYTGNTSRTNAASGLGLTIAKTMAEKMGGTMTAEIKDHFFCLTMSFPKIR